MELIHGGNIYDENIREKKAELLDFSANINPLGMPDGVKKAIIEAMEMAEHYPDPLNRRLKQALALEYHLPKDWFICGNGGADLIYRLVYAVKPKRALLTAPTFAEYEEALKQVHTELFFYEMDSDLTVKDDFLDQMELVFGCEESGVMFLCNPNNPTGILVEPGLLLQILEKAKDLHILLVLDECFLDLCGKLEQSLIGKVEKYPNLFILKSFTKMYAMPGIRLGYGISRHEELLRDMEKAGQCWGVSVLAEEAGIAALREKTYCKKAVELIGEERIWLKEQLERLGCKVWNGQADYLLFQIKCIPDLYDRLFEYGILIRRCENYRGLDSEFYRVAVKKHKDNQYLIDCMEKVLR